MTPTAARTAWAGAAALCFAGAAWLEGGGAMALPACAALWLALRDDERPARAGLHAMLFALALASIAAAPVAALAPWAYTPAALAASAPFGVAGWAAARWRRSGRAASAAAFVLVWIAVEAAAGASAWGEHALPMLSIGPVLVDTPWLQAARWSGASGLTLLLLASGIAAAELGAAWAGRPRGRARDARLALAACALAALLIGGAWRDPAPPRHPIRMRIVQPALDERAQAASRMVPALRAERIDFLARASRGAPGPVLWPEGALPEPLPWPLRQGRPAPLPADATVLLGAATRREDGLYNSALLWRGGQLRRVADKRFRVPWLESRLRRGAAEGPFAWAGLSWGVLVCWEALHAELAREAARDGATALAVLANASFDPHGPSARLHLRLARLRAAETGLPVAFASQTGPSALIDARGRVTARLRRGERGTLDARWPAAQEPTPYRSWGDGLARAALLFAVPCCAGALRRGTARAGRGVIA